MIGIYNYTVVMTYISLISSVFGMTQAVEGRFKTAIFCLALSGLCDMFDGKIARSKKDRTEDEKNFGIQIDSLCDVVCFGAFPALICYLLGVRGILGVAVLSVYCVNSVIRLGFFNVLEGKRQQIEEGANKYYHGLPVTSIAIALPLVFLLHFFLTEFVFIILLHVLMLGVGILFIVDFPLHKPGNAMLTLIVTIVGVAVLIMILHSRYRVPKPNPVEPDLKGIIVEEIIGDED